MRLVIADTGPLNYLILIGHVHLLPLLFEKVVLPTSLSPELEKRIAQEVERGDVASAAALVEYALTFYLEYEDSDMDEDEIRETQSAINEALEQGRRGEGGLRNRSSRTCGPNMAYRVEFRLRIPPTRPDKAITRQMTLKWNACFHLTTWSFVPRTPKSVPRYAPLMRQLSGVRTRLTWSTACGPRVSYSCRLLRS